MEEFKMCSDGEFLPVSLPCPPPFSGPYYYFPYETIPNPPAAGGSYNNYDSNNGGSGGAPISAGAVAGIIILIGVIVTMICLLGIKFRSRIFSLSRNSHGPGIHSEQGSAGAGDLAAMNSGDVLFDVAGGGLEEKLVNLLPVFEYVKLQDYDDGKKLLMDVHQKAEGSSSCECAVCLSSFEEKEIVRILPKCKHVFHILCIDKWFESHANCPLCRERITLQTIQHFFKTSEDNITLDIDVDDDGHPAQLDTRQDGGGNIDDYGAVAAAAHVVETGNENCNAQHADAAPTACLNDQSYNLIHQQDRGAAAPADDHDQTYSKLSGSGDDAGHRSTKAYIEASDLAVNEEKLEHAGIHVQVNYTCPAVIIHDRGSDQSFSFPGKQDPLSQSGRLMLEMQSCRYLGDDQDHLHHPAALFTHNSNIISSPMLFHHNSNLKRSISVGSLPQHINGRPPPPSFQSQSYNSQEFL